MKLLYKAHIGQQSHPVGGPTGDGKPLQAPAALAAAVNPVAPVGTFDTLLYIPKSVLYIYTVLLDLFYTIQTLSN